MQFPITIGLRRSVFLSAAIAALHVAAGAAIWLPVWPLWVRGLLMAGVGVSAVLAWRGQAFRVLALRLCDPSRLECRLGGDDAFLPAELLPGANVHPWLTVMCLKVRERKHFAVVLPDSTTADEFRRLRVWLRWRANARAGADAA